MAKFRKLPVEITAISFYELCEIAHRQAENPYVMYCGHRVERFGDDFVISTPEGDMLMTKHDMLITGVKGEIYPCKIDIFNKTYELVI